MIGSPANRPLVLLRWFLYALLLVSTMVVPYLSDSNAQFDLVRSLWMAGAFAIFLVLYNVTYLPATNRLTFQRLGLMLGETGLVILLVAFNGGPGGAFATALIFPPVLIALEHHWKYGLMSGAVVSLYLLLGLSGSPTPHQVILIQLMFCLPLIGIALKESERLRLSTGEVDELNKLDKAYHIARRETSKRQEQEQELYQERRRFEGLVHIAHGLAQEQHEDQLLNKIVEVATDQLSAQGAVVFLLRDGRLYPRAEQGLSDPTVRALQRLIDLELLRELSASRRPLVFGSNDPLLEDPANTKLLRRFSRLIDPKGERRPSEMQIKQLVGVPLATVQDNQAFGMILIFNHILDKPFTAVETRYLEVLATNSAIALKNILFTVELERSHWELIQALAQAIEAKDSYTSNHVGRVRDLSVEIARTIGLDREQTRVIAIAATLHDVGKISTPDRVLLKPGPLTDEEYEIMKQHAANGAQILRGIRSLPAAVEPMVRHHHERWDGRGYPDGKSGRDIPLGAQIISIADCFDAMTYDRPYRKGFPKVEALKKMELGCGTQFNPKLLCAFFAIQGFVPKTEPTAIDTYQAIIGRLHLGTSIGSEHEAIPHNRTGSSESRTELNVKPLLLEKN